MKNKWYNIFLTGTIVACMLGGMVMAEDFSDGISKENTISEDILDENISDGDISDEEVVGEDIADENIYGEIFYSDIVDEEILNEKILSETNEEELFTVFTSENIELLDAFDEGAAETLEAIESGEVFAVAPVDLAELENAGTILLTSEEGTALTAVSSSTYTIISAGPYYCDEVWSEANAAYPSPDTGYSYVHPNYRQCTVDRKIRYTDANGNIKTSPLYCLNATKSGINPGSGGELIKEEALSLITNSTMKKILYFGYGGPGDICDDYDPTCKHIDWSAVRNRYVFTHLALSIVYSKDAGYATDEEVEHVGLNKFISHLKSLTIPNRKAVKLSVNDSDGNLVTGSSLSVNSILYRTPPENKINGLSEAFADGYQITPLILVSDEGKAGNGIRLYAEESDEWQILYWKTKEEYNSTRGEYKPRILQAGKNVLLKDGASFRIVFPKEYAKNISFKYEMSLYPVSYLMVNGNVQRYENEFQNMGAYVYQDTKGTVKLTVNPAPRGSIQLSKVSDYDESAVKNADFTLKAAENLYSGDVLVYKKNDVVDIGTTNKKGILIFEDLVPGKYKLQETKTPSGYLANTKTYSKTVKKGKVTTVNIVNIPDLKGYVEIEKLVEGTKLHLSDAKFSIYSWDESSQDYSGTVYKVSYDDSTKKYISPQISYSAKNKGKFRIIETKNPTGYSGNWQKDFQLKNKTSVQKFSYVVENSPSSVKKIEIQKICEKTEKILKDAEFTLYEYSNKSGAYKKKGMVLSYDQKKAKYVSEELQITDDNLGKFKVVETKNPEGYTGEWSQKINLFDHSQTYQFIVENTPIVYPKGTISIKKTDSLTGECLNNAEFTIYVWEKDSNTYLENPFDCVVMEYDVEKEEYLSGELEITPQNQGKYKIVETKNPEGYSGVWEKEVVMSEESLDLYLEVENQPDNLPLGEITVVKKIKEDDIVWSHGNPTFHFVIEGIDLYGKYHRYENYVRYVENSYSIDKNNYAIINCVFSKIPIGTYRVYERPVFRYYLKEAVANSTNVSIIKGKDGSYGINPDEIAYGIVKLSTEERTSQITFINEKQRFDDYSHDHVVKNVIGITNIFEE